MLTFNPLQKLSSSNESKNDDNSEKKSLKKVDVKIETSVNDIKKDEIINSNDDWITLFDSLSVSPFARNYFGSMSFQSYSEFTLTLVANEDMGEVPENIMTEFKSSLKDKFSNKIDVKIQTGNTSNSPIATSNRRNEKHQSDAENNIKSDKDIQSFINKFNGKIKSDTIKPIK